MKAEGNDFRFRFDRRELMAQAASSLKAPPASIADHPCGLSSDHSSKVGTQSWSQNRSH